MYITFEGPNFVGKTTAIVQIRQQMIDMNIPVSTIQGIDKGNNLIAELIEREDRKFKSPYLVNVLLKAAEKYYTYFNKIKPILDSSQILLSDRCFISCLAYGYLYNMDMELIWAIYADLPKADLTILLNCPAEVLDERMQQRANLSDSEKKFTRQQEVKAYDNARNFLSKKGFQFFEFDTDNDNTALIMELIKKSLPLHLSLNPVMKY